MKSAEIQAQALSRAAGGMSTMNYSAILEGFAAKGISEADISPRENVFTFQAWKALGRFVKKGEHGVRVCTFREFPAKDNKGIPTGRMVRAPWYTTVFHVSQTEAAN